MISCFHVAFMYFQTIFLCHGQRRIDDKRATMSLDGSPLYFLLCDFGWVNKLQLFALQSLERWKMKFSENDKNLRLVKYFILSRYLLEIMGNIFIIGFVKHFG